MSVKRKSTVPQTGQKKSKIVPNNGPKEGKANKPISKKIEEPELDDLDDEDEFHGFGDDSDENNESNSELEDVESEEENEEEESEGDSADEMVIETSTRPQKSGKDIKPESVTPKEVPVHAAQRALAKERKLQKPNAVKLHEAKKVWESLRVQKQSKEERQKQIDQLFKLIKGVIASLVFEHSASRFVQTAVKYGNSEQRIAIAKELEGRYIELAKSKYGKFLVLKILEYGNEQVRNLVIKEFMGNVAKLLNHKDAGVIMNDIYRDICTTDQKREILSELYGPEFRIFKTEKPLSLEQILKEKPEKKELISKNLVELVKNCMKKDIINLDLVHTCLLQALEISTTKDIEELVSLFKDQIHQLAHTKDGAHASCLILSYGTAKDRKAAVKAIRDIIPQMALDQYGHMILIVLCAVVDDTKLVSKSVLAELKSSWHDLIRDKWGRNVVLFLCREGNDPLLKECRDKSVNTSKKDSQLRRKELLESVSEELLGIVAAETEELMRDPLTIQVVQEILLSAEGDKSRAVNAIVALAAGDPSDAGHIINLSYTARVYKTLVQGGHYNAKEKKLEVVDSEHHFAKTFYQGIKSQVVAWAIGPGSFVIVALLETLPQGETKSLLSQLKENQESLTKHSSANKGTKIIVEKLG